MASNIVFVGGGSFLWTERFAIDLFLRGSLRGSRLTLVDTDVPAREMMAAYVRQVNTRMDAGWSIGTAPLDEALDGADIVMVSISTGGLEAFERDYRIPERYGVFHTVGDTVGPAGISRTLRNVPVFVDIARRMERRCPRAWLIHVTNPLAQLTRCVAATTAIRTVGLCHNYEGCLMYLAKFCGAERGEMDAATFGVNHFTWLHNPTCRGAAIGEHLTLDAFHAFDTRRRGPVETGTTDDEINAMTGAELPHDERLSFELCERFGHFPVGGPEHISENFPFYLNDPAIIRRHRIRRKGVLPNRQEGKERKRRRIEDLLAGREPFPEPVASHESLAAIVESLHTGQPSRAVVNLPNTGQLANLPRDTVVETWATIDRDRIIPEPFGAVPTVLKGAIEAIIAEEELAVQAALTGDRHAFVQALAVSPLLHNKDAAEALADDLLAAQRDFLPQFRTPAGR